MDGSPIGAPGPARSEGGALPAQSSAALTLHGLLDTAPVRASVSDRYRRLTSGELSAEADSWAAIFADAGLAGGDRVALLLRNGVSLAAAVFGASRRGLVSAPLHPATPGAQLSGILDDFRPGIIVRDADFAIAALEATAGTRCVVIEPGVPPARGRAAAPATPCDTPLVLYTSGSTAVPRGVVCPHSGVTFAVAAIRSRLSYGPDDIVFSCLPMSFDYGLYQLFLGLGAGSHMFFADSDIGPGLLAASAAAGATIIPLVPSIGRQLCLLARRRHAALPPVRLFTNTGDTLTPKDCEDLRATFPGAQVVRMFGLTECKRVTISGPDEDLVAPSALGRPLPGTSIEIRDEHGGLRNTGDLGELVVRGPHVMSGYWGDPAETARRYRAINERPALFTGDLGWIDEAGRFCFSHREDDLFKVGAVRVSASELEDAAMASPIVRAAAVARHSSSPEPVMFVVTDEKERDVVIDLARRLGPRKTPRCVVVDELPVTRNGKIDRAELGRRVMDLPRRRNS